MWKIIRKMFINIIFVTVIYIVSYTNRDSNGILQVNHLSQFFLNTRSSTDSFTEIITINDYWKWLQISFISNIRIQSWYNGDLPENMTDYINDKSNRMIGWATMRQLRMKLNASCQVPTIIRALFNSCIKGYSIINEDQHSYSPGWLSSNNNSYSSTINNAFIYRSSSELDSYIYIGDHGTYGSGGYVYEFLGDLNALEENLTILRELSWIDQQTHAVIIQLNLYNPNVKFFTSVTLLIEITEIGDVFPLAKIEPIQMYIEFNDFSSIFYIVIAIIYIIFIFILTIHEIYSIYKLKKKYFYEIRSYIEWGIIACSWTGVGVYSWRYSEANRIGKYLYQTNGLQNINLQLATYINDILTFLLGFICFFGTIRLLRLFDIYPHINMYSKTLKHALNDIISFSLMFFLLFFAFVVLFYLLFISKLWSCSTILRTCEMLFEMLLLEFHFSDFQNANAFLGPFVFTLFIYFVVFIGLTMFITIITQHLHYIRKHIDKYENIYPNIFTFIIKDLIKRTGLKKLTNEELQEEYDRIMYSKYQNPVEQLPKKVNELFNALDKVIISYPKSENTSIANSILQRKHRRRKRVIYST